MHHGLLVEDKFRAVGAASLHVKRGHNVSFITGLNTVSLQAQEHRIKSLEVDLENAVDF